MTVIASKEHAVLGPSGWDRWSNCPGSVVLEEGRPNVTSSYAAWGSVAHEIAAYCLTNNADAEAFVDDTFTCDGHEITVDMEMADTVNSFLAVVHSLIDPTRGDILLVEQEVPIGHLTGETGATGTADVAGIVDEGRKLVVIDFKGGAGVPVYAYEEVAENFAAAGIVPQINGQLAMYGLGALEKLGLIYEDIEKVELVISQPRISEEPSSITISVDELRAFGEEVTIAAGRVELNQEQYRYDRALAGSIAALDLHPGEKQCKFCRAKAICPALAAEVSTQLVPLSSAEPAEFENLTLPKQASSVVIDSETDVECLASFMRATPLIEEAIKAVRAEVERRLFTGLPVPGFKLVEGRKGNRQWADPDTVEEELKKRLGAKGAYVKKVISVAEAEKQFKAKPRTWAKIVGLITQAPGKPSVAPESDKRPPLQLGAAPDDFADLTAIDPKFIPNTEENLEARFALAAQKSEASALLAD